MTVRMYCNTKILGRSMTRGRPRVMQLLLAGFLRDRHLIAIGEMLLVLLFKVFAADFEWRLFGLLPYSHCGQTTALSCTIQQVRLTASMLACTQSC